MDVWTLPGVPVTEDELELATLLRDALGYPSFIDLQRDALHWLCLQHKDLLRREHIPYPHPQLWAGRITRRRGVGRGPGDRPAPTQGWLPGVPAEGWGAPPRPADPAVPPAAGS